MNAAYPQPSHQNDSVSFTIQPEDPADRDGGGSAPFTGGAGDATHPEDWAANLGVAELRERVIAAGLDPGDLDSTELVTLLKQTKPSNRTASIGTAGDGASGGHG